MSKVSTTTGYGAEPTALALAAKDVIDSFHAFGQHKDSPLVRWEVSPEAMKKLILALHGYDPDQGSKLKNYLVDAAIDLSLCLMPIHGGNPAITVDGWQKLERLRMAAQAYLDEIDKLG